MFGAWGRRLYRRRWLALVANGGIVAGAIAALCGGGRLTTGAIRGIESERAQRLAEDTVGLPGASSFTIVFHSATLTAADPRFEQAMRAALAPLEHDPRVAAVESPLDEPPPLAARFLSSDGHRALAAVTLRDPVHEAAREYASLRAAIEPGPLDLTFTGMLPFLHDLDAVLERDLHRAELVSLPLALLVLLVVFRTLVAAMLPVGVGALAVLTGVAGVLVLSRFVDMAQYTINVVSLIGLGVAIDYSLFIVSRYRDELAAGAGVEEAIARALETAGRAVVFSGLAVVVGLSGLLFFRGSYLAAMGVAGALVVGLAVFYALTFLPALLAILGPRIDLGRIPLPHTRTEEAWRRIAAGVMRRPVAVLVPTLAAVLATGAPFLHLRLAAADVTALPRSAEARRGYEVLRRWFPAAAATRILVAVRFPTAPAFTPERARALAAASRRFAALPGVSGVESAVDVDPRLDADAYAQLAATPAALRPPAFNAALARTAGGHVALLSVLTAAPTVSPEAAAIVRAIRAHRRVGDGALLVGGETANDMDSTDFVLDRTPRAIGFVTAMTYLVLFALLGSVVLPLKAVAVNALSIAGSFGALVWIFQEGHWSGLLGFEPGPIEPTLPVLLFCAVFGLSMDYEVLLLSRIQEEYRRSGDNTAAVAEGLARSGRLITSAAAIMVAVFTAFALAKVVLLKAMGLGMAIAVALDATLVRVLIVPATMRLFGDLNWWAPAPLARLWARARGVRLVR
ncbi:MAG TPA: MMPL family transporter [Candidatus Binatia bacterium]|nr:MMPL family transporter [Candidatus Binatia bacterium]